FPRPLSKKQGNLQGILQKIRIRAAKELKFDRPINGFQINSLCSRAGNFFSLAGNRTAQPPALPHFDAVKTMIPGSDESCRNKYQTKITSPAPRRWRCRRGRGLRRTRSRAENRRSFPWRGT